MINSIKIIFDVGNQDVTWNLTFGIQPGGLSGHMCRNMLIYCLRGTYKYTMFLIPGDHIETRSWEFNLMYYEPVC